jgi:hypothetical protein
VQLIQHDSIFVKEQASTCLAMVATRMKEDFVPHFTQTLKFLIGFLQKFSVSNHKQFCGHLIEAITMICSAVGEEHFKPISEDVIKLLLDI